MKEIRLDLWATFVVLILLAPRELWACASCGCTLSSAWENSTSSGFRFDLRYDYIDQDKLRRGVSTISPTDASQISNNGNSQEVEVYTVNNYLTATLGYTINPDWRVDLQVPYIIRRHSTLGTASNGETAGPGGGEYDSSTSNLGDVKVIASYQGLLPQHDFGIMFGLKLPTGSFNLTGSSTDPTAPGAVPIDRGLQPGTGTTDVIYGLYYLNAFNKDWDYYAQAFYQSALNSRSDYRPGDGANLNLGLRYMSFSSVMPQLQLNTRYVNTDAGLNADRVSTGGTLVYLSPGAVVPVGHQASVYAFVQVPVYQYVVGVQLTPTYTASLGGRYAF